jgi:hypothetical protein
MSRRKALALAAASIGPGAAVRASSAQESGATMVVSVAPDAEGARPFHPDDFGFVGVYDVDLLLRSEFTRLLDNLAASPGAFLGVRFFGSFTAGHLESIQPNRGGTVWPRVDRPIDFSVPLRALAALTSRGLTPFVVLGFFPPAVSDSPIAPPDSWDAWKTLVRAFLTELAADSRFGPDAIRQWWFEVWNEPNEGRFWRGTAEQYLDLHRATSEAVRETGLSIRLGGPAIAYKPEQGDEYGRPWMERFLRFLVAEPDVQCDFVSLHRKGTVTADEPDVRRLYSAGQEIADLALAIDPVRFAGLTIVNDEADEKVGFEVPYPPRVDHRNAAWLAAVVGVHATLNERYRPSGLRFLAAADNANLHLVQAPFDGRRSIMTRATTSAPTDLLKVPAYGYYELLRLLGDRQGTLVTGAETCFPATDLFHVVTADDDRIAALLSFYPTPGQVSATPRTVEYVIRDVPWPRINVARFQIDRTLSNAYTAAGGTPDNPYPVPAKGAIADIRLRQELTLFAPIRRGLDLADATFRETLALEPYATVCLWLTPTIPDPPVAPKWLAITVVGGNVVLSWTPNQEPFFLGYEAYLIRDGAPHQRLTPEPLRAALWIDTAPPPGRRVYGVRAVTASGVPSAIAVGQPIEVRPR